MDPNIAYLPIDRCYNMTRGEGLSCNTSGAVLILELAGLYALAGRMAQPGKKWGVGTFQAVSKEIFNRLLRPIHALRGSVLALEGDRLLAWFAGDTGLRAVTCARLLQEIAGELNPIAAVGCGEPVDLSVRGAIAAGKARRMVVGDASLQVFDLLAGDLLDQLRLAVQAWSKPDDLFVTGAVFAALSDRLQGSAVGKGDLFQVEDAHPLEAMSPWPDLTRTLTPAELRPWLPPFVHERLNRGQELDALSFVPAAILSIVFASREIDGGSSARDGRRFDQFIRWVQNNLDRQDGHMVGIEIGRSSGCVRAVFFGSPVADDNLRRAVLAALTLQTLPQRLAYIDRIQIGIAAENCLVGTLGSEDRRGFVALAPRPDRALLMAHGALPNQILIGQSVLAAVQHQVAWTALPQTSPMSAASQAPATAAVFGYLNPRGAGETQSPFPSSFPSSTSKKLPVNLP